jgi:4-hydroxybenzoyl-CoA thioesterase
MSFVKQAVVRFAHVDAAGIVFYPRYFEMVNAALEDFFAQAIGVDFRVLHVDRRIGVPTVKLDSEFMAPSRLGDVLDIAITVERVGGSSATLRYDFSCAGTARLVVRCVIVCMDLKSAKSTPWPAEIKDRLSPPAEPQPASAGLLSPSDKPRVEEVADGFEAGTLDARG